VTVIMPKATAADALSTAFSLLPEVGIVNVLRRTGGEVRLVSANGEKRILTARVD
jgi:thiamine biosynthesis lipoprotein